MNPDTDAAVLEILGGLYIQSLRIYDLLAIIADRIGADVEGLSDLHSQGYTLGPDPSLRLDDDEA
jgi:hypothetical protein